MRTHRISGICALLLSLFAPHLGFSQDSKAPVGYSEQATAPTNAAASTNSMEALDSKRKLLIGDRVSYRVVEEREPTSKQLQITDSGDLDAPLIGRVPAQGKTCLQLAQEIKALLEKEYFYKATVIIGLDARSVQSRGMVYLMGPVKSQGQMEIPLEGSFTMSKAILRAGGFTDFANPKKVKLIRKSEKGAKPQEYNIGEILKGKPGEDPVLEPEDIIVVPEKFFNM